MNAIFNLKQVYMLALITGAFWMLGTTLAGAQSYDQIDTRGANSYAYFPNQQSIDQVCKEAGYVSGVATDMRNWNSCGNNRPMAWDGHAWVQASGCTFFNTAHCTKDIKLAVNAQSPNIDAQKVVYNAPTGISVYDLGSVSNNVRVIANELNGGVYISGNNISWRLASGWVGRNYDQSTGLMQSFSSGIDPVMGPATDSIFYVKGSGGTGKNVTRFDLNTAQSVPFINYSSSGQIGLSSDKFIIMDYVSNRWDLFKYDLAGVKQKITTDEAVLDGMTNPKISGDHIVWIDNRTGNHDVYMYDLAPTLPNQRTFSMYELYSLMNMPLPGGTAFAPMSAPKICQSVGFSTVSLASTRRWNSPSNNFLVVWNGTQWNTFRASNNSPYWLDSVTCSGSIPHETRITTDGADQKNPAIDGDWIVWDDYRDGSYGEVYAYDIKNRIEKRLTNSRSIKGAPSISRGRVVWTQQPIDGNGVAYGTADLYAMDLISDRKLAAVTVQKSGNAQGKIMSYPYAIDCGTVCSYNFDQGDKVTFKAMPDTGARFFKWSTVSADGGTNTVVPPVEGSSTLTVTLGATSSVFNAEFRSIRPDVTISNINVTQSGTDFISPGRIILGKSFNVDFKVNNLGAQEAAQQNIRVDLLNSNNVVLASKNVTMPFMSGDDSFTRTASFVNNETLEGVYKITVTADDKNKVAEIDETNNVTSRQVEFVRFYNLNVGVTSGASVLIASGTHQKTCSGSCAINVEKGLQVTVTPILTTEKQFNGWTDPSICTNSDKEAKCVVDMSSPRNVFANIATFQGTLTAQVSPVTLGEVVLMRGTKEAFRGRLGGKNNFEAPNLDAGSYTVTVTGHQPVTVALIGSQASRKAWAKALSLKPNKTGEYAKIVSLYDTLLGRVPDEDGLIYWVAQYALGVRFDQMEGMFKSTTEYTTREAIKAVYLLSYGRPALLSELSGWMGKWYAGKTLAQIKKEIAALPEFINKKPLQWTFDLTEFAGLTGKSGYFANGYANTSIICGRANYGRVVSLTSALTPRRSIFSGSREVWNMNAWNGSGSWLIVGSTSYLTSVTCSD